MSKPICFAVHAGSALRLAGSAICCGGAGAVCASGDDFGLVTRCWHEDEMRMLASSTSDSFLCKFSPLRCPPPYKGGAL